MDVFNKAMLDQVSAIIADGAMNLTIEEAMDKMEAFLFPWLRIFWAVLNNGKGGFAVELLNPVRNYLRERKDAIRSILSLLTDDSSLLEEDQAENLDEDGDLDDMDWLPEPIDSFGTRKERLAAIVSRLLDIHDTREAYVNEFQELLAKKLLEFDDDDEDQHIANVELLAAKLGQHGMDQCRVMISDLHESQRHDDDMATGNGLLRAVVLSTACWPDFEDVHDMTMPQSIHEDMGDYEYAYREKQKARHLVWMPNYGRVVLNLEFNGEFREFRCSPGEATVIELFGEDEEGKAHDTWTLDGLANELEMSAERVHPYIQFWVKHGAVTEGPPGTYKVNDNLRDVGNASMEIDPEPPEGKHSAEEEDGLDLTPNLIKNRLGFEKSQTAEQILEYYSGMAKMGLAIRDLTVEDVENLMNNMLNEGVLSLAKGVYSLKRA
ncbi:Anaphase-promoting complex subunit 2 [Rhizophlyctis rosea]|uniref:Anaphase-promoting complex subunit 2 n=1 Tax=Rhizophlyctis rosea TaxID=64517 RepID=A0AAD5SKW9_9FUNG|nr:Anaphase-promoting complex subunit 2 [Rhizophlyctis rosea]